MKKCVAVIGATVLEVWAAAAADVPKVGVYLGYEYVRFNSATNVPAFNAHGGGGQFIYNLNDWLSGVFDVGAVHNGNIGDLRLDSTFINFLAGPRFSIRRSKRFIPYVQVLWGGVHGTSSVEITGVPIQPLLTSAPLAPAPDQAITTRLPASDTAFAMTAGGGLDIKVTRHVSVRPIAVDYYLTRLQNLHTADDNNNQNNLRYSAGVTFLFGGEKPTTPPHPGAAPPPRLNLMVGVKATSRELCQGDTTQVVATVSAAGANQLNYTWSVNGQPISQGPSFAFGGAGRVPGTYNIKVAVGGNNFNPTSAGTTVTVLEYRPPTGTVSANPPQVQAGGTSLLSASFEGQCGGKIQAPTFEASEGSVRGDQFDSTAVRFDAANNAGQRKTVTITAKAADSRNVGTATTTIEVVKPAAAAPIRLPDVLFPKNSARVNNCGKRILLEQLRTYTQRDSAGIVVLVGHASGDETAAKLAEHRVLNAAALITAGSGVCLAIPQSQVQMSAPGVEQNGVPFEAGFCQSSVGGGVSTTVDMRRVVIWFVPTGSKVPASATNNQSAGSLPVSSLGCPK